MNKISESIQVMLEIGKYNQLEVKRRTDNGFYLTDGEDEVLLPNKYTDGLKEGDSVNLFVYTDSEDRPVATTEKPYAIVGDFASLYVKDNTSVGTFMDWGLEKDLFVPWREQFGDMREGYRYVVRLCLDNISNRVVGVAKINSFFNEDTSALTEREEVDLLVYNQTDLGFSVVVNNQYKGIIYHNEIYDSLEVGESRKGFVQKIRKDGRLDIGLQRQGYAAVVDTKDVIVDALIKAGGFLPYHDKTEAEEIKKVFKMSKKNFKRIIGSLYKAGLVEISPKGIQLVVK